MTSNEKSFIPPKGIENAILVIREQKILLDSDLAELYGVETKALVRAVKRNMERFPGRFMFQLSKSEFENLRYQFGTSRWGGRRYSPYAFTEQGVAMLSGILHSKRAIQVNIAIMDTFVRLRKLLNSNDELGRKLRAIEQKVKHHDADIEIVFSLIGGLLEKPTEPHKKSDEIGFQLDNQ